MTKNYDTFDVVQFGDSEVENSRLTDSRINQSHLNGDGLENSHLNLGSLKKDWNFSPAKSWPTALPAFAFKDQLLCAFDQKIKNIVFLDDAELTEAFFSIYPELSFPEVARLAHRLPLNEIQRQKFWSHYGYHWKASLQAVADCLVQIPLETQQLFQEKKLGPQDLAPLRSLESLEPLKAFWIPLKECQASKSELIKILEWIIELHLMGVSEEQILLPREGEQKTLASAWQKHLYRLRFPKTESADEGSEKMIKSLSWPLRSEARWSRRGDLSGVELKLFFSHPQELKRSLMKLEQICADLENKTELEDLWSKQ